MVQEFHVVRCFTCEKFQVQQVKKATRWSCKVCGEKQSLLKEFGRGSGADCRRHVQKLNAMIGAVVEEQEESPWEPEEEKNDQVTVTQTQVSRWSKYMETPEEAELEEEQQLHGNNMTDRKRRDSPEQFCRNPEKPSARTSSPPESSRARSRSPNENKGSCGHFSRWTCFLGCDSQVQESRDPVVNGGCQQVGGDTSLSCGDIITSSRPLLPVSSLFETEDDFSFDEF
ncbi:MRN complex-interacting protein isoform X1 [Hippoglossus hippoglossus]|uniref:MRN complex-interacting protein isoform X1 n=1 Tax=Hippoglossus hippoglossus TaxID=8267 RepID=UPI00148C5050|nr:MRN complex-interacting protein isoform X1 [Hippoglossus hippoglossus]